MRKMVKPPPKAQIEESIPIIEWERNRRGQTNRVSLRSYLGHSLFDIRIWWTGDDGITQHPGKGFSCRLKELPKLQQAVTQALKCARERGLLDSEDAE
jgi:Transcriptional Coactivator p15 (PC4)